MTNERLESFRVWALHSLLVVSVMTGCDLGIPIGR
jgi:hypothetical protein